MRSTLLRHSSATGARARTVIAGSRFWVPLVVGAYLGGLACEDSTGFASESDRLIQTDSPEYALRSDWIGWRLEIAYTFTNRTGGAVYLVNCNGSFGIHLDREENGVWHLAWSPVIPACLSPPIVIEKNATFTDTLDVWGAPPGSEAHPQFDLEDPSGTYRIVWDAALSSFRADEYPFGPDIPLEMRVSNRFALRK